MIGRALKLLGAGIAGLCVVRCLVLAMIVNLESVRILNDALGRHTPQIVDCESTVVASGYADQPVHRRYLHAQGLWGRGCREEAVDALSAVFQEEQEENWRGLVLGNWLLEIGDRDRAMDIYWQADVQRHFTIMYEAAMRDGMRDKAVYAAERAFEIEPTRGFAAELSVYYVQRWRVDDVVRVWKRLSDAYPVEHKEHWLGVAMIACLGPSPDRAEVIAAVDQARLIAPLDAFESLHFGRCLLEVGETQRAASLLGAACESGSNFESMWVCLQMGDLQTTPEAKLKWYEYARQRGPDNVWPVCKIASTYRQQVRYSKAAELIQSMLDLGQLHPCLYYELARSLWALGDQCGAIAAQRQGIALETTQYGGNPGEWLNLGDWYVAVGNYPKASQAYDEALALQPDSQVVQERIRGLADYDTSADEYRCGGE